MLALVGFRSVLQSATVLGDSGDGAHFRRIRRYLPGYRPFRCWTNICTTSAKYSRDHKDHDIITGTLYRYDDYLIAAGGEHALLPVVTATIRRLLVR